MKKKERKYGSVLCNGIFDKLLINHEGTVRAAYICVVKLVS